ncbi:MAG TPA: very short patch repair endonuclease [Patescibacteria group bacterium]|nr:very short patch repair endonuclease [Patescibacteria group bacterium]
MDRHTPEQRSFNMSQVKSKNTKPELLMFKLLRKNGIKFEKHYSIYGKPDIAFPTYKVAVFIDGEFWHGKDFKALETTIPPFWVKKIGENIKRDGKTARKLRTEGWHVMHIWDKRVIRQPKQSLQRIIRFLERVKSSY